MGRRGALLLGSALLCGPAFSADYVTVATLHRDGTTEIGLTFAPIVDLSSTLLLSQYQLADHDISSIRHVPQNGAIVLSTSTLDGGSTCTFNSLKSTDGKTIPEFSASVLPGAFEWVAIGSQELGFTPDAVAIGTNGFDLISGGFQLFDTYDEATFAYETVSGDFDKHVRVDYHDPSSRWARAGLMVRETLDAGRPRPSDPFDPAQAFSRYLEVHVTPALTAYGDPASNMHEINFRPFTGGIGSPEFDVTENPTIADNAAPEYPNAWLRIKRTGQLFTVYRGTDGTNWVQLGSFTFPTQDVNGSPVPPFPNTVYVGPSYSPENGNIPVSTGTRAAFIARFRDYGGTSTPGGTTPPELKITKNSGQVELSWEGTALLQSNSNLKSNLWTDLPSISSPHKLQPTGKAIYYRLKI
jgi:hypothetical protein